MALVTTHRVREIAALQQRVETLRSTPRVSAEQIDRLRERLAMLQQHIETCVDDVPPLKQDRQPLREALLRVATEIDQVAQAPSGSTTRLDWKQAYAAFDSEDRARYAAALAREEKTTIDPLKQQHQVELAAITRESRDLGDQVQAIRDKQSGIQTKIDRGIERLTLGRMSHA